MGCVVNQKMIKCMIVECDLKTDKIAKKYSLSGQMLHAAMLGFIHPKTAEYVEFSTPPPDYFLQVVRDLDIASGCEPFTF